MKWRLLYNTVLFISLVITPWPVYTGLLCAGIFLFRNFYEAILWLVVVEILFGPLGVGFLGHYYLLMMLVVLFVLAFVKKTMRYYE